MKMHLFLIFGRTFLDKERKSLYLCNVFFIVLDLRLTKVRVAAATHFFCPYLKWLFENKRGLFNNKAGLLMNKAGLFNNKAGLFNNKAGLLRNKECEADTFHRFFDGVVINVIA